MPHINLKNSPYYLNRHESWLAFNRRVLEEARVIEEILQNYLRDNTKSRLMRADGCHVRALPGAGFPAQRAGFQCSGLLHRIGTSKTNADATGFHRNGGECRLILVGHEKVQLGA